VVDTEDVLLFSISSESWLAGTLFVVAAPGPASAAASSRVTSLRRTASLMVTQDWVVMSEGDWVSQVSKEEQ